MITRLVMLAVITGLMGFQAAGCSEGEKKKETAKASEVTALDGAGLQQALSLKKFKMVEFGGRHCIPCKNMQAILLELSKSYGDSVSIANVFVQEHLQLGRDYQVRLIPTQIIFDKAGKEVFRHTGFWDKSEILAKWKELGILKQGT